MTPAEAVAELARGLKDPDEVAKRLWEAGALVARRQPVISGSVMAIDLEVDYCPLARYINARVGTNHRVWIGVTSWNVRGGGPKGNLPKVLRDFVQHYDSGDYDNLTSEVAA